MSKIQPPIKHGDERKVLQPIVSNVVNLPAPENWNGGVVIEFTDAVGTHEFETTLKMWDKVYSKNAKFSLKKK